MTKPIIDEDKVLPVSLRVLITIIAAAVISILAYTNIVQRLDAHDIKFAANESRLTAVEGHQTKTDNVLNYLQILMVRVADKLNVDTTNPLDKGPTIKNLSSDIYLPF